MNRFYEACSVILGLVFIAAAVDKVLHPALFAQVVVNYQILPPVLINPVAMVLPWLEFACGAALACGVMRRGASVIITGMLAVFIGLMWYNISRGLDISCGCFSVRPGARGDMMISVWRDTVLFSLAVISCWRAFADHAAERASARLQRDIRLGRLRPAPASVPVSVPAAGAAFGLATEALTTPDVHAEAADWAAPSGLEWTPQASEEAGFAEAGFAEPDGQSEEYRSLLAQEPDAALAADAAEGAEVEATTPMQWELEDSFATDDAASEPRKDATDEDEKST
ncbi:hypothetical protein GGQ74_000649 [Desulfobaculum xiamenense]|uniref:Methylamine utilisation protein MauE domain-containing protein n=1 Tax=Desulfobaculum xiamenense TaxID=995050 RepID=A0A846QQS9_9BACT|nr:MauE/DoxX family redox-associated membrane protein [Desulfobaculum xiamenense]NJB67009.1 hypothetical protein [Desulfobaculum xiamenense]